MFFRFARFAFRLLSKRAGFRRLAPSYRTACSGCAPPCRLRRRMVAALWVGLARLH